MPRAGDTSEASELRSAPGGVHLARYTLVESAILSGAGALRGIPLAMAGLSALVAIAPAALPRLHEIQLSGTLLLFTTGMAVGSAMLFGMVPALLGCREAVRTFHGMDQAGDCPGLTSSRCPDPFGQGATCAIFDDQTCAIFDGR